MQHLELLSFLEQNGGFVAEDEVPSQFADELNDAMDSGVITYFSHETLGVYQYEITEKGKQVLVRHRTEDE